MIPNLFRTHFLHFLLLFCLIILTASKIAHEETEASFTIVAFGDSLTAGYGLPKSAAFPVQLEQKLKAKGHNVAVINAGVSGETTAGGVSRVNSIIAYEPDLVILELGANDALRGLPPGQAAENLAAIIRALMAKQIPILLTGMRAPVNMGPQYAGLFDKIYPNLAKTYGLKLYPFFLDGVALNAQYNLPDGIHPNAEGIRIITDRILPYVEPFIKE